MQNSIKAFGAVFIGLMALYMVSIIAELNQLHNALKPAFMILLMIFHYRKIKGSYLLFSKLILFGLFFSWIGDVALMINKTGLFFIVGLGSFLIAHLGYSIGFYFTIKNSNTQFRYKNAALLALPYLAVTVPFFLFIKDGLVSITNGAEQDLTVPVLAYTIVISIMGIVSSWRLNHVNKQTFQWILIGAILFILSDCVLAINLFSIKPEPHSLISKSLQIANMTLYLSGQFMITIGAIYHVSSSKQVSKGF